MQEPVKVGDICIILRGVTGTDSPNTGKIVKCVAFCGETHQYGRIFTIEGQGLIRIDGTIGTSADLPGRWLKPIRPPKKKDPSTDKNKELENV